MLFYEVMESGPAGFKQSGRPADVIAGQRQRLADGFYLGRFTGMFQGKWFLLLRLCKSVFQPQVDGVDDTAGVGAQGPADAVLEFPDIARP